VNGIFSATPAPRLVRLVVGSEGLLLIQSVIAWHLPDTPSSQRLLILITGLLAISALVLGLIGEMRTVRRPDGRPGHGR